MAGTGPLEVLVVGFAGPTLPSGVADALALMQADGRVRVVEAHVITRTGGGAVRAEGVTGALAPSGGGPARPAGTGSYWLDRDSLAEVGAGMAPGSTALALVLEHRTARDVVSDLSRLGGAVLVSTRSAPETGAG